MLFDGIYVGKRAKKVSSSPRFEAYTGVRLLVSDDVTYEAGDMNGNVLEISSPWGTQQIANDILRRSSGYQYQPYEADGAIVDAAAELGDGISINGVFSGIYKQSIDYNGLMAANVSAPKGSDIDHEYPHISKATRQATRQYREIKATLKVNRENIEAKVEEERKSREGAIQSLSSSLTLTNQNIEAKVSKSGGDAASFGWNLTDSAWTVSANGSDVLTATRSGLAITGAITATSGTIGGCVIENGVLKIGAANITSINADNITVGTLSVDRIVDGSITGAKIGQSEITGGYYNSDGGFVPGNIATDGIVNGNIASGSIWNSTLGGGCVSNAKLNSELQDAIAEALYAKKVFAGTVQSNFAKASAVWAVNTFRCKGYDVKVVKRSEMNSYQYVLVSNGG